jgi:hypothetical protein
MWFGGGRRVRCQVIYIRQNIYTQRENGVSFTYIQGRVLVQISKRSQKLYKWSEVTGAESFLPVGAAAYQKLKYIIEGQGK